jgi:uncharacterized protein
VGCRSRAAKSDLLRLVAIGNEIVPDPPARGPGRGAYLHPSQGCFEEAQRRRAFARALRLPGPLGTGRLAEYLGGQSRQGGMLPVAAGRMSAGSERAGRAGQGRAGAGQPGPGEQAEIAMSDR